MRIIGIDPGYAIVGFGVVEYNGVDFKTIGYGAITTDAGTPFDIRLKTIYEDLLSVIELYKGGINGNRKNYFSTPTKRQRLMLHKLEVL